MLFNSYPFVFVFLPVVVTGYYLLRRQGHRLAFVIAASYVFYAWEEWWFPALMVVSTGVSFTGGLALERASSVRARKLTLAAGIAGVLSLLLFFKYAGFAAYYLSEAFDTATGTGLPTVQEFTRGIVLPVGISFFTFEAISYQVDVYRGVVPAERNLLRYAFFISFFPHLIAGPIVRYGKLAPQLELLRRFDTAEFRAGLLLFTFGLAKKVLFADGIARHVNAEFVDPTKVGALDAWTGMFGYSFQIYFDFSGYTDMALGLALMVGIALPWNFNRPYRASSPRDFWRRWHVTLSTWLRDYLYIPLGGNKKGTLRRDVNLLTTMGLGGLWHGASTNFVAWGLYHGALLVAQHRLERLRIRVPHVLAVATTFTLVTIGWVLFRFRVSGEIREMLGAMVGLNGVGAPVLGLIPYLLGSAAVVYLLPEEWSWDYRSWGPRRVALAGAVGGLALVSLNDAVEFLYFQF